MSTNTTFLRRGTQELRRSLRHIRGKEIGVISQGSNKSGSSGHPRSTPSIAHKEIMGSYRKTLAATHKKHKATLGSKKYRNTLRSKYRSMMKGTKSGS